MRRALLAAALLLAALFAAEALAQQPNHPLEQDLAQQWQAAQTGQANVGRAVDQVLRALRQSREELAKAKAEADALREKCGDPCKSDKP